MKKTFAEFEEFTKSKGRKVEDGGNVAFGKNGDAAIQFETEAHKADFSVTRMHADDPKFYHARKKIAVPKIWLERLEKRRHPQPKERKKTRMLRLFLAAKKKKPGSSP